MAVGADCLVRFVGQSLQLVGGHRRVRHLHGDRNAEAPAEAGGIAGREAGNRLAVTLGWTNPRLNNLKGTQQWVPF